MLVEKKNTYIPGVAVQLIAIPHQSNAAVIQVSLFLYSGEYLGPMLQYAEESGILASEARCLEFLSYELISRKESGKLAQLQRAIAEGASLKVELWASAQCLVSLSLDAANRTAKMAAIAPRPRRQP